MRKSKQKKKKKETFFLPFLLFSVKKRAKKVSGFVFFRKGTGKM